MRDNYYLRGSPPAFIPDGPEGDRIRALWPSLGAGPCEVGFIPEGWTAEQMVSGEYARFKEKEAAEAAELEALSRLELEALKQEIEGELPDDGEPIADKMAAMRARKAEIREAKRAENQRLHAAKELAKGRVYQVGNADH